MFFIRGQHAARGCKTQQMYTMKTTPSRSGSAASLIALAALGHPGLAQDYGGLTFPSSYFAYATTKVDTGNGRKYPCVRIVVKDGWQKGVALFSCKGRSMLEMAMAAPHLLKREGASGNGQAFPVARAFIVDGDAASVNNIPRPAQQRRHARGRANAPYAHERRAVDLP